MTHHHDLSAQELKSYQASGYLIRKDVLSLSEITQLRAAAERAVNHAIEMCIAGKTYILDGKRFVDINHVTVQFEPGPDNQQVRVIEPVNELDAELDQLVEDLALWTAKLNLKRPREGSGFGWHQDSPYWIHDCDHVDQLPNVMIAFDDADRHNGCFMVIKGSHKQGCLPGKDDGSQLGGFYTDTRCFDEADEVAMEVSAGSVIFFDPHTVHGSAANESIQPRRAIIITYQPAGFPQLKS